VQIAKSGVNRKYATCGTLELSQLLTGVYKVPSDAVSEKKLVREIALHYTSPGKPLQYHSGHQLTMKMQVAHNKNVPIANLVFPERNTLDFLSK
jgi:hypothetical protein